MSLQLDLFRDSRAVVLVNEAIHALTARDLSRAKEAISDLRDYDAADEHLRPLQALLHLVTQWTGPAPQASAIAQAAEWIEEKLQNASGVLGKNAQQFLAGFHDELADIARGLPYDAGHPKGHRAWSCLRASRWSEAERAALDIKHYKTCTDALHWLTLARYRLSGLKAARPTLLAAALCEPKRFPVLMAALDDHTLQQEWESFQDASEWGSVDTEQLAAWFPAWYLLEFPASAADVAEVDFPSSPAGRAAKQVLHLLELERQGMGKRLIAERESLRGLNRDLFDIYLQRRSVQHH